MTKKEIITFLTIILVLISLILPISSYATSANLYQYNYDYEITSYNIDMVVNENNTFDITETITAYFNVSKHGIFRKIPLKNSITRLDRTKSKNKAQISNISVDEDYTTYNENGYKVIKIGDANRTLTGSQTYTIKYTYNIGKDPVKNADELYFNLIGDEWDTTINNISFKITMPKSFDKSLLGFSSGQTGSTNSSNVRYNVIGNTITGTVNNILKPGEALTVRLTLPDEYFVGAGLKIDRFSVFVIAVCLVCVFIAFRLWVKYGKDEQVIETVEFYPPEGYNSAEVGFLYKGESDNQSIISLLIYLANKGYLKIEEISRENINDFDKINDEEKKNANLKIQELENKIKEEELKNVNSPKIRIWKNSLEIYKNIDKPIEYEFSEKEKILLQKSLRKSKVKFRIIKLKDYDGNNEYERIFFEGLFSKYSTKTSITDADLYNNFYRTLNRIKSKLDSKKNKHKIFESSSSGKGKWLFLMIIAIFILITLKPILEYSDITVSVNGTPTNSPVAALPFAILFPGIGFTVLFSMLLGKTPKTAKIFGLIWGLRIWRISMGIYSSSMSNTKYIPFSNLFYRNCLYSCYCNI